MERKIPDRLGYHFIENGRTDSIEKDKANEIIEEILNVVKKNNLTVDTSKKFLQIAISSIDKETIVN